MVGRQATCFLILGLVLVGCAQTDGRPSSRLGLLGRRNAPRDDRPTLSISEPASVPVAASGPPAPAAPLAARPDTPEILQVQAQQTPDSGPKVLPLPAPPAGAPPAPQVFEPSNPLAQMREIYKQAAEKHAAMDSYTMRLRRREVVNGQSRPEEILLFKWRREPWSVYFKWLGTEGKGREVVYVKGRYENALHTLTAAGDIPLLPAGKRIKLAPDGAMVRAKSRYPITEAGLGGLIERYGRMVDALEKGDSREGTAKYLGQLKRPEFDTKVEGVQQIVPPRSDPHLPRGGQRLWFFDTSLHLPMLIITQDETGREVEYYCHDRFMYPVHHTDDDFNPDVLWKSAPAH